MTIFKKKLIEVALPLEAINQESVREKEPFTRNHPRSVHIWWARRPLAACRAVLFSSLVDDPSAWPERFPTEKEQENERLRLFAIIEQLVKWENSNNEQVLLAAQTEIANSIARNNGDALPENGKAVKQYLAEKAPPVLDPFCGGGSIPLEAQRLGLRAYGSDLNPIPVLITKALIEIPPKFAGKPPVHPEDINENKLNLSHEWKAAAGLAEDVRYYGKWMRDEAEKRIGKYYPKAMITKEVVKERPDLKQYEGQELTVIAWLWARTVESSNPVYAKCCVPQIKSFWLSKKPGKQVWIQPLIDTNSKTYNFKIRIGIPSSSERKDIEAGTKLGRGCKFRCLLSNSPISEHHIKDAGRKNTLGATLMAAVAEGRNGRVYIEPSHALFETVGKIDRPWNIDTIAVPLADDPRNLWCLGYGIDKFDKLFSPRQLLALATFSNLVVEAHAKVLKDAIGSSIFISDDKTLDEDGFGAKAYADSVATYLGMGVSRWSDLSNTICSWNTTNQNIRALFARQAIPMSWDYAELSPFSNLAPITSSIEASSNYLETIAAIIPGKAIQIDATSAVNSTENPLISTDPPYYDNIGYADLSDFFYVWLRRSLGKIYPQLFSTLLTPKNQELIASPYRHSGNKEKAHVFFEDGLGKAFNRMREKHNSQFPMTVYYAFKQSEDDADGDTESRLPQVASTGWETMLSGLANAGFSIHGTWPMRTERGSRSVGLGTNALASSIVLVCRPRPSNAPLATRKDFISALSKELPAALRNLQRGNIAPVDLAQASIGPGMAIFTRYSKVLEADGSTMSVRTALQLINQELDTYLSEQEGELDRDTRFCLDWFSQNSMNESVYGDAETLARAKNTSVQGLVDSGTIHSKAGKVRLLRRDEYPEDWDPTTDSRLTVWECTQHLIRLLETKGETAAAQLAVKLGGRADDARALAYRLYSICERKGWAQEALSYNSLVIAWPEIMKLTRETRPETIQEELF